MAAKTTKRREVWVNDREGVLGGTCEEARSDAAMLGGRPVKFVESRPGDVVLSREDARALDALVHAFGHLVGPNLELRPNDEVDFEALAAAKKAVALLRGGR